MFQQKMYCPQHVHDLFLGASVKVVDDDGQSVGTLSIWFTVVLVDHLKQNLEVQETKICRKERDCQNQLLM